MARVDFDSVKLACESLLKEGQRISASNVLGITGGSKGTVVKYLRQWREEVEKKQTALVESLGLSPEFLCALNKEISRYTTEIEGKYTTLLSQTKDSEQFAISALEDAEKTIDAQNKEISDLKNDLMRVNDIVNTLQKNISEKDEQARSLTESRDQALVSTAKLDAKLESLAPYQQKAQQLQNDLDSEKQLRHQAELSIAKLETQLNLKNGK